MNFKLSSLLAAAAVALGAQASWAAPESSLVGANSEETATSGATTFLCETSGLTPMTIARVVDENGEQIDRPVLTWNETYFSPLEAERLCDYVADRLQSDYDDGTLAEQSIASGEVDGRPVVCLQGADADGCEAEGILFALAPEYNAKAALLDMAGDDLKPKIRLRGDFPTVLNLESLFRSIAGN